MNEDTQTGVSERNSFAFYWSFKDAIRDMSDVDKLAIYEAITDFAFFGIEPDGLAPVGRLAWKLIRPQLEASIRRYDTCVSNGAKGKEFGKLDGRPRKSKTPGDNPKEKPQTETPTHNPLNHNHNHNHNDKNISLSLSPSCEVAEETGGVTPAERENFLKILFFEKKLISPQNELTRFLRHYEKSGWVDANGNKIRSKTAALGAWRPDKDAVKCPDKIVAVWQEVYDAASRASPGTDCTPLLTLFRGIQLDGSSIYILAADKALMDFIEHPARIEPIGAVIRRHFGTGKQTTYRIIKQKT